MDFLVHHRDGYKAGSAAFDSENSGPRGATLTIKTPCKRSGQLFFVPLSTDRPIWQGRICFIHIHLNARSGLVVLAARLNGYQGGIIVHSHAALTFRRLPRLWAVFWHRRKLALKQLIFAGFGDRFWDARMKPSTVSFLRWPSRDNPAL